MNLTIENYEKALRIAKRYMKRYPPGLINAKDAHDIAMDSVLKEQEITPIIVSRNIIDQARSQYGRFDRPHSKKIEGVEKRQRKFICIYDSRIPSYDPEPQVFKDEALLDLASRLKHLNPKLLYIAINIAQGKSQQDLAKEYNVSTSRMCQLVQKIRTEIRKDPEWNHKIQILSEE